MKRAGILAAGCFALLLAPGAAEAACVQEGKVARLYSVSGPRARGYVEISVTAARFPAAYYRFSFVDDRHAAMAAAAAAGHLTLIITGNAASCPSEGSTRFGGSIELMEINANR